MKTAKEILGLQNSDVKLDKEATELANLLVDQISKRKIESVSSENVSVSKVLTFKYGSYDYAEALVKRAAGILYNHGFYVETGYCETTPSGNERPMIRVWLTKPKYCNLPVYLLIFTILVLVLLLLTLII